MWTKIKPYILPYSIAIAIPVTVGISAAAITRDSMDIYGKLNTPPLSPPALIFPIVWSVLYILMGISSAMVFTKRQGNPDDAAKGLKFYSISLIFNFAWSIVFFRLQAAFFALIILILLLCSIFYTVFYYFKVNRTAAYLQIPYIVWVIFAGYLNAGIWLLNQ